MFIIRAGLTGKTGEISLESSKKPGFYLFNSGWYGKIVKNSGTTGFANHASWIPKELSGEGISLAASNYPNHFLRGVNERYGLRVRVLEAKLKSWKWLSSFNVCPTPDCVVQGDTCQETCDHGFFE